MGKLLKMGIRADYDIYNYCVNCNKKYDKSIHYCNKCGSRLRYTQCTRNAKRVKVYNRY